jgi:hypothetical protein
LRQRGLAALLVLALLLAQWLGLVHRGVHGFAPAHGDGAHGAAAQARQHAAPAGFTLQAQDRHAQDEHADGRGWSGLFPHDDGDTECRLFDAASHDGAPPPVITLPLNIPAAAVLAMRAGEALARWAAMFQARGPPRIR